MTKAILIEMFFSESTCASADEDAATSAAKTVTRPNRTDIRILPFPLPDVHPRPIAAAAHGGLCHTPAYLITRHPATDSSPGGARVDGSSRVAEICYVSAMAKSINIKNEEAASLVAELTAATGKGTTELILELLRHEAESRRRFSKLPKRRNRIDAILRRARKKIPKDAPPTG